VRGSVARLGVPPQSRLRLRRRLVVPPRPHHPPVLADTAAQQNFCGESATIAEYGMTLQRLGSNRESENIRTLC
jgi:hypothetical protein